MDDATTRDDGPFEIARALGMLPGGAGGDDAPDDPGAVKSLGLMVVPLAGFRMRGGGIELDSVRVVDARSTPAPADAVAAARRWGGHLALAPCQGVPGGPAAVLGDELRRLVRALRLLKSGGVGLGPQAWVGGGSNWKRLATGAMRPRPGGYELGPAEAVDLQALWGQLGERAGRGSPPSWALARFDAASERPSPIEALSDYLLALRGLLEGGGPARAGLAARAAALGAGDADRAEARAIVDRAVALERKLMSGSRVTPGGVSPLAIVDGVEDLLRRILRAMAAGEVGGDPRAAADEILVSEGLEAGAGEPAGPGETAEWRLPDLDRAEELLAEEWPQGSDGPPDEPDPAAEPPADRPAVEPPFERDPAFNDEEETRIVAFGGESGGTMGEDRDTTRLGASDADWFDAAAEEELEWPRFAAPSPKRRQEGEPSDRVRHLFPVPDSDWDVADFAYERKKSG